MFDKKISEVKKEKDELITQIENLVHEFLNRNDDISIDISVSTITSDSIIPNKNVLVGLNIESTLRII